MDKITEALKNLLPADQLEGVVEAVNSSLEEAKAELEAEFNKNLEEAYAELSEKVAADEKTAIEGYQQAWDIITDLRNRNDMIKAEYESAIEEGFEEAYQTILAERGKNENVESEIHETYEKKFEESKGFVVDKLDLFLRNKGKELYEMARRDVVSDPSMVEHKVVLDNIVETVSNYITDEERILATSSRLEQAKKDLEDAKATIRRLEGKNIKLSSENNKLSETVKEAAELISESTLVATKDEKKARLESVKNATGRGEIDTDKKNVKIISEYADEPKKSVKEEDTLAESFDIDALKQMQVLAGVRNND